MVYIFVLLVSYCLLLKGQMCDEDKLPANFQYSCCRKIYFAEYVICLLLHDPIPSKRNDFITEMQNIFAKITCISVDFIMRVQFLFGYFDQFDFNYVCIAYIHFLTRYAFYRNEPPADFITKFHFWCRAT